MKNANQDVQSLFPRMSIGVMGSVGVKLEAMTVKLYRIWVLPSLGVGMFLLQEHAQVYHRKLLKGLKEKVAQ